MYSLDEPPPTECEWKFWIAKRCFKRYTF